MFLASSKKCSSSFSPEFTLCPSLQTSILSLLGRVMLLLGDLGLVVNDVLHCLLARQDRLGVGVGDVQTCKAHVRMSTTCVCSLLFYILSQKQVCSGNLSNKRSLINNLNKRNSRAILCIVCYASKPNSSSKAMTSSTASRLSRPRPSMKCDDSVAWCHM